MIPLQEIKTIFFDYDGTLHNSISIYAPAFRRAYAFLVKAGAAKERPWTEQEISCWLGYNPAEMWKKFMPGLKEELRQQSSLIISEEMARLTGQGKAVLYEGAAETLGYLKNKGYHLCFISNCKVYYKEVHARHFQLNQYFESMVCSEDFAFISKADILARIKTGFPGKIVIIGDRKQDIDAGRRNRIHTIGCRYGFAREGELEEADLLIDNILELQQIF